MQKIALVGTELSEAVEAMRKQGYEDNGYGIGVKDSFADEIVDTIQDYLACVSHK